MTQRKLNFRASDFNAKARPQDDLYAHVNSKYQASHKIPADQLGVGTFYDLRNRAIENVNALCKENKGTLYGKLYRSFMDEAKVNAKIKKIGNSPIEKTSKKLEKITTLAEYSRLGYQMSLSTHFLFPVVLEVANNPKNRDINIVFIEQSGIGLPDESYYRLDQFKPIREKYLELITKLFKKFHLDYSAQDVLDFETEVAQHHYDLNKLRDIDLMVNLRKTPQLGKLCKNIDFAEIFKNYKVRNHAKMDVNIGQLEFFKQIDKFWNQENFGKIKAWNMFHVIFSYASVLSEDIQKISFEFSKLLTGQQKMQPRYKRAVGLVDSFLGEAVGKDYVARHFPKHHKQEIDKLVQNLLKAYHKSISNLDWLDEPTRKGALKKLKNLRVKIGYKKHFESYKGLKLGSSLFANFDKLRLWHLQHTLGKIGKKVDPDAWEMTPQTVNAYFHPLNNEIVFPAAILQPPFFDPDAYLAENYGAIGAVIGHEIGHCFDDQGSKFDFNGNVKNWWSKQVYSNFQKRTAKLIKEYNGQISRFAPKEYKVDGKRTLGENIGDLGGLSIAWNAYVEAVGGDENKESTKDFTAKQIFFFSWARSWRANMRKEYMQTRISVDPHSPEDLRANITPQNLQIFYEAFGVTEKDKLFLARKDRVSIW